MGFRDWLGFPGVADKPTITDETGEPSPVTCTYCHGTKFFEGPSGGMSQNILCANPECRHWFNYHGGILPMDDLHRVEPSAEEKAKEVDASQLARDQQFAERMNIGAVDYRSHGSIAVLRQRQLEKRWTYPKPEQIDELCGFIMGMCDEIKTLREMMTTTAIVLPENRRAELSDMLEHRGASGELIGMVSAYGGPGMRPYGRDPVTNVFVGAYVRINTRVLVKTRSRPATVVAHDDAWNNQVRYDDGSTEWEGRAPAFDKSDGSGPLTDDDLTTVKGAEKVTLKHHKEE